MKKQELIDLGIAEDVAEKVIVLHGKDIEAQKTKISDLTANQSSLTTQLEEANKQIEGFKGMKIDEIKAAADDYKAKFEKAQTDAATNLLAVKRNHALERDLKEVYKVKNVKAVTALLNQDELKFNEKDESFIGLKEQVEPIKTSDNYLFTDETVPPKIVLGGNNKPIVGNAFTDAARRGAKLPEQGK